MNFKKLILFIWFSIGIILIPCILQSEPLKFSPTKGETKWEDGKEYSEMVSNKIKIRVRYDKVEWPYIVFDVVVSNDSRKDILFDPAVSYLVPVKELSDLNNEKKISDSLPRIEALDPGIGYSKNYDDGSGAGSAFDDAMDCLGCCLGGVGEAAAVASDDKEMQREAEEASKDADESMRLKEEERQKKIKAHNDEVESVNDSLIKKSTISPGKSKEGKIYFSAQPDVKYIILKFPAGKDFLEFTFSSVNSSGK